jgi:cell division protein FtsW
MNGLQAFLRRPQEQGDLPTRLLRWLTLFWTVIGLGVLFSASYAEAISKTGDGLYIIKRQLLWVLLGLGLFYLAQRWPLKRWLAIAPYGLLVGLLLIALTLFPMLGETVGGATRWLKLGPLLLQPSELVKPFLVLQGAKVFGQWNRLSVEQRLLWLGVFGAVILIILRQPNLSTAALCGMLLWMIALASGLNWAYILGTATAGVALAAASVSHNEYQLKRIVSFLNPWKDAQGDGYQLVQSLLAIGSGGIWGAGYGNSQQKLFWLPIQTTDFIFAVYAEEFGLLGSLLLLLFLVLYGSLGVIVALKARWNIQKLIAIGAVTLLIGQSFLNIGVASGALPTTGLPLPLFSYGGNAVLASLLTAGLLVRVGIETAEGESSPPNSSDSSVGSEPLQRRPSRRR